VSVSCGWVFEQSSCIAVAAFHANIQDGSAKSAAKPARVGIDIGDNFFSPKSVTVAAGTTVVWQNRGGGEVQHNVVAEDSSFASADVGPGNTFTYTFSVPGRFGYVCTYHVPQGMTGEIIVE
jgi:plastocyanin